MRRKRCAGEKSGTALVQKKEKKTEKEKPREDDKWVCGSVCMVVVIPKQRFKENNYFIMNEMVKFRGWQIH